MSDTNLSLHPIGRRSPRRAAALAVAVAVLVLGGCGSDGGSSDGAGGSGATTTAAGGAGSSGSADVRVADSDLGPILVDGDGNTLYAFTPDSATASTCNDSCAATWPPLVVDGSPEGDGVEGDLATVERDDGSTQVSVGGHPLYTYAADAEPGDTTGQGVGGSWYVVGADGELVQASGSDGSSGGDGGY